MPHKFTGIAFNKQTSLWRARYTREDGRRVWLKEEFFSEEAAARAYDTAVLKDGLPAQPLNFATRSLPKTKSLVGNDLAGSSPKAGSGDVIIGDSSPLNSTSVVEDSKVAKSEKNSAKGLSETKKKTKTENKKIVKKENDKKRKAEEAKVDPEEKEAAKKQKRENLWDEIREKAETVLKNWPGVRAPVETKNMTDGVIKDLYQLVECCHAHGQFERYFEPLLKRLMENPKDWKGFGRPSTMNRLPRLFALDCEMVMCRRKGNNSDEPQSTLARLSLVEFKFNENSEFGKARKRDDQFVVLLDEHVRIDDGMEIVDLLTHVSGVEASDLEKAKKSHEDVLKQLEGIIDTKDVVVGHSLWADFNALRFWHGNYVDTSALCMVRDLESLTLSLKDVAFGILKDKDEIEQFQKTGESHDSIADAMWSVRVMFRLLELSKQKNFVLPHIFEEVPQRYQSRLTFHLLPARVTEDELASHLRRFLPKEDTKFEVNPIKRAKRKDGSVTGSSAIEFQSPDDAHSTFKSLKTVQNGCGGYSSSGPCAEMGWPDRQRMMRKLILAPGAGDALETCEVIWHRPAKLSFTKEIIVHSKAIGRVMGPMGRTVLMIQQVSGTQIVITRQPQPSSPVQEFRTTATLQVSANTQAKLEKGFQMVHAAMKRALNLS